MASTGVVFALDLGLLSLKDKTAVRQRIEKAGGVIAPIIGASVRVLITTPTVQAAGSYKLSSAQSLGIPIFLLEELDEVLAFPPAPREPSAAPSRALGARKTAEPEAKRPLIVWDDSSSVFASSSAHSDPYPSSDPSHDVKEQVSEYDTPPGFDSAQFAGLFGDLNLSSSSITPVLSSAATRSSSVAAPTPYATLHDDDDDTFPFLSLDVDDFSVPSGVPQSSSTAVSWSVARGQDKETPYEVDNTEYEMRGLFDGDDFVSAPAAPSIRPVRRDHASKASPVAAAPKLSAKERLEASLAHLSKTLSPDAFNRLTQTSASSIEKKSSFSSTSEAKTKQPSAAMAARAAKYQQVFSKAPVTLTVAPILATPPAPITFTPLKFDLKPTSLKPISTTFGLRTSSGSSSSSVPVVFECLQSEENLINGDASSSPRSDLSGQSLSGSTLSSSSSSIGSPSEHDSSEHLAHKDDVYPSLGDDGESYDDDEDYDVSFGAEMDVDDDLLVSKKNAVHGASHPAAAPAPKRKVPRIYVDRRTGVMWQRKSKNPPTKLILDSGDGFSRVFKLTDSASIVIEAPKANAISASVSVASSSSGPLALSGSAANLALVNGVPVSSSLVPFSASDFGPALPVRPSKVVKEVFTGRLNPKFSWTDIVMGKASTTKRVPAMDGCKLFVSGVSFADLEAHGKPREEQFAAYKAAYMDKLKEKNKKAVYRLKKKARKLALEHGTASAEGVVTAASDDQLVAMGASKKSKLASDASIVRMKTDEQLMNEIVQWPQRRVEAAVAQRKLFYASIFNRFGDVTHFVPDWNKGFIHVTYKSSVAATAAMRALKDFDTRVALVRSLKDSVLARKSQVSLESLPSPSFYVRWTTCYQRKLNKKAKTVADKRQAEIDAAVAKNAVAASSSLPSTSNDKKKKSKKATATSSGVASSSS